MSGAKKKILDALNNSPHRWRTASAIAKETGLALKEVTRVLQHAPEIAQARKGSNDGETLFARTEKRSIDQLHDVAREPLSREDNTGGVGSKFLVLLPVDVSTRPLKQTIKKVIYQEKGEPTFLDEIRPGAAWVDQITQQIKRNDAVIADVSRVNANVMFELGMAHGLGKPLILILSETSQANLPTDLVGYQTLFYTPGNFSAFEARLSRTVQQLMRHRGAL